MKDKYQNVGFNKKINEERAAKVLAFSCGDNVLEVGCGEGQLTKHLVEKHKKVVAIDIDSNGFKFIKNQHNLLKNQTSVYKMKFTNMFDTVICTNVLEHLDNPKKALKNILNAGKKDCVYIFTVPNAHSVNRLVGADIGIIKHPTCLDIQDIELGHKKMYSPSSFRWLIDEYFKIFHFETYIYKPFPNNVMEKFSIDFQKYCLNHHIGMYGAEIFVGAMRK